MPVILERSPIPGCRLAIWHMTESLKELEDYLDIIPEHESKLSNFKYDKRKLEWICTRALVKHLVPELTQVNIIYDINGKPHLESKENTTDYHISISHSHDDVAVMVSKEATVGIDLETIHDRILKIATRFINEDEMNAIEEENSLEHMYVLWGAKEVIFKLYSIGELSFHNEIIVDRFVYAEKGALKGFILKDNFTKSYSLYYEKINNLMLVYGRDN